MNNFIEYIQSVKSSLTKQENNERQTGRTTRIINQAKANEATVVCATYIHKKYIENHDVRCLTIEEYLKETDISSKTYFFDHYTTYCLMQKHYDELISKYTNKNARANER